jgi:predicted dehydrogenase
MQDPVRWGVLGAADFARGAMARAIHAAEGADLVALATTSPAKAEGFLAFQPRLRVHPSYEALLEDPEVDAVYVPLPNHLHVEWTVKALEAGKHVLTEKPIAMHASEFDRLIAARDRAGRLAAEAYMIVHHPQWIRARELVQGGAIGRLLHVDAAFSYDNRADPGNIRNRPETGGGSLPDIGVYVFGSTRFVSGEEPEAVTQAQVTRENDVDVVAHVFARFPSFTYAGFTSMRMFPRQEVVFHGDRGVLRVAPAPFNAGSFDQAEVTLEAATTRTTERFPGVNHYVLQVEAFGRSVREGAPYACPLEWSRGTQAMIDMVLGAERRG